MWEKLQQRLEVRCAQIRAHPELLFLLALAYVGLILMLKDANRTLGAFGIVASLAIAGIAALLVERLRDRRPPDPKPQPQPQPQPTDPPRAKEADEVMPLRLVRPAEEDVRRYLVRVPPSTEVAYRVVRKAQDVFRSGATDPEEDMRAFHSDPYSLICLQDAQEQILGFVDYYAFEKNHFKLFLQGHYTFANLLAGGQLSHPQARKAKVVYLATILNLGYLLDSMRIERRRQNGILIWAAVSAILEHHTFPPDGIDIYSIGWDRGGVAILKMFGLLPVGRVIRGQAEGKGIYCRRGVQRKDLEAIRDRYQRRYGHWCALGVRPLPATQPGVALAR
ncbi:hypothetical protein [Ensifer sp.]|uniref:hypothetical protein n=1 Tax=Ensifer sp. TaxID=1872086 RepID=UPI002E0DEC4C|nr:hypothetical protein [Ensifer sp.]